MLFHPCCDVGIIGPASGDYFITTNVEKVVDGDFGYFRKDTIEYLVGKVLSRVQGNIIDVGRILWAVDSQLWITKSPAVR